MVGGRRSIVKADSRFAITCRKIPEEILVEILVRLPAHSLMRFKCVSKIWSSLISSRYFTNLFFEFSSSKPERRVFLYEHDDCMLFSSSLSNIDATDSFLQLNHDLTIPEMIEEDDFYLVNAIRGLICFKVRAGIRIINFTTRQNLSLPLVKPTNMSGMIHVWKYFGIHVWKYFGYDPVNDEYKVLNVFSDFGEVFEVSKGKYATRVISEAQVLVLGAGAFWRNTKISTSPPLPHWPHGQGISINGVLYYHASFSHEGRYVLMSFDLNSEEFNWIEIPMDAHGKRSLMNYQDQVTVFDDSRLTTESILDLWVLDDVGKSKWSHKVFSLPYHELGLSISIDYLKIRGTGRRGEIWLCQSFVNENEKNTLVVYNVEKKRITRGFVMGPPCPSSWILNLWEDVENIIHLEAWKF